MANNRKGKTFSAVLYGTYLFKDKDPVIDELRTLQQDAQITYAEIHQRSGVSTTTLYNWFGGPTKRPQSASVEAVGRAMGFKRTWTPMSEYAKRKIRTVTK